MCFGQCHYSGTYWSATERHHVIYESRLELANLLLADFDSTVHHIVAQPFSLRAEVDGQFRRHVPDYLLDTDGGPVVADVVRTERMAHPKIASFVVRVDDNDHRINGLVLPCRERAASHPLGPQSTRCAVAHRTQSNNRSCAKNDTNLRPSPDDTKRPRAWRARRRITLLRSNRRRRRVARAR